MVGLSLPSQVKGRWGTANVSLASIRSTTVATLFCLVTAFDSSSSDIFAQLELIANRAEWNFSPFLLNCEGVVTAVTPAGLNSLLIH